MYPGIEALLSTILAVTAFAPCEDRSSFKAQPAPAAELQIADFDPSADVVLDLGAFGAEPVDDAAIARAFDSSFVAMDTCIEDLKARHAIESTRIEGGLSVAIKLNPAGPPLGINVALSHGRWNQEVKLRGCLKRAFYGVRFPRWNGPPRIAEFEIDQIDPGFEAQ